LVFNKPTCYRPNYFKRHNIFAMPQAPQR
jgi:hypothetical protein